MKVTFEIMSCSQCPHFKYIEDIEYYEEPYCMENKPKRLPGSGMGARAVVKEGIPEWCPLISK